MSRRLRTVRARAAAALVAGVAVVGLVGCTAPTSGDQSVDTGTAATSTGPAWGTSGPSGSTTGATGQATPMGAKWDWGRFTEFGPFLKSVSGGTTYYEVVWCDVEKKQGSPDWSSLDRIATRSREIGTTLMLKLRVGRCWATSGDAQYQRGSKAKTESAMPTDLGAYKAWVQAAVTRYSKLGVHEYAIENEINSASFWAGTPQQFETLARAASGEIRASDPEAKVVDAGLSSTSYGYGIADWLLKQGRDADALSAWNAYFERRIGTRGNQIVAVHTRADLETALKSEQGVRNLVYLDLMRQLAASKVTDVRQIHFYEKYSAVPTLFAYLKSHTPYGTPIQAWEVGSFDKSGATTDDATKSEEVLKTMSLVLAEGATVAVWLPLAFDPGGRNGDEPRYGLLEPDGQVRQAGRIFQAMVEASRGAKVVKISVAGMTGVGFDRGGTATAFVWSDGHAVVQLPDGGKAASVESLDKPTAGATTTLGATPQRLTLPVPTATFLKEQR
ncbi:hypothetical protein [Phycicoccus sp. Soil748]|uniref:hypothetical protein n=1 Tax=Phycicoccus sp. Soil748 TaxID=1736397 RepID=UPI000703432F|nr:hypothetical protein [Phycicoccus sp. Soil748]KRE58807.1 hypothetical protein ASG70_16275 [Phycicoccus sp. Soil748]